MYSPIVKRENLMAGAGRAEGLTVIIDVFRAFTCAPILFSFGVERYILEPDPARGLALRTGPEFVLIGEVNEVPIEGFDLGNSPSEIMRRGRGFFAGKTVVHRTTAGVRGVRAAVSAGAEEVLLGSFLTARAVASYIREKQPPVVTIVPMGIRGESPAPEDETCADYLQSLLQGTVYDHLDTLNRVVFNETAQKFLRGDKQYLPREDPLIALQRDLFSFALRAEERDGLIEVFRADGRAD